MPPCVVLNLMTLQFSSGCLSDEHNGMKRRQGHSVRCDDTVLGAGATGNKFTMELRSDWEDKLQLVQRSSLILCVTVLRD